MRLLHYESWSGEEFVRKWVNILDSGSKVSFRPAREPTAVALRALVALDLPEKKLRTYLMRIFERTTEDDFETLLDLGLLEEIDPLSGKHRPEQLGAERQAQLEALLAAIAAGEQVALPHRAYGGRPGRHPRAGQRAARRSPGSHRAQRLADAGRAPGYCGHR